MDKESVISFRRTFVPTSTINSLLQPEASRHEVDELTQVASKISKLANLFSPENSVIN